jgi:hypothetical protein
MEFGCRWIWREVLVCDLMIRDSLPTGTMQILIYYTTSRRHGDSARGHCRRPYTMQAQPSVKHRCKIIKWPFTIQIMWAAWSAEATKTFDSSLCCDLGDAVLLRPTKVPNKDIASQRMRGGRLSKASQKWRILKW